MRHETTPFAVQLGVRIRQARSDAALTQQELGTKVGLTRSSIANIEAGRQQVLAESLMMFSTVLKCDPHWLLTGRGPSPTPSPEVRLLLAYLDEVVNAGLRAQQAITERAAPAPPCNTSAPSRSSILEMLVTQESDRAGGKPVPGYLKVTSNAVTTQHIIGERIRHLRELRGWSARELAERCEHPLMTRSAIAKIESGRRMFVTFDELDALATVFGLSRSEFLPGHQSPGAAAAQA